MNFVVSARTKQYDWPITCACAELLSNRPNYVHSTHRQTLRTIVELDQASACSLFTDEGSLLKTSSFHSLLSVPDCMPVSVLGLLLLWPSRVSL